MSLQAYAGFTPLYAKPNKYPFIYKRSLDDENILVVLNPSAVDVEVNIALEDAGKPEKLIGTGILLDIGIGFTKVSCKGRSYSVFKY
jgi:hypothetical protein